MSKAAIALTNERKKAGENLRIDFSSDIPIFAQIAREIEDGILSGAYEEESQVPSTTEIASSFKINPATVLKGVNMLTDQEILYKKRGVGMFVQKNAKEKISVKRRNEFFEAYIMKLIDEATKLGITKSELIAMIEGEI